MATKKAIKKPRQDANLAGLGSGDVWHSNPGVIREFLGLRPDHEQLCAEVEYILRNRLSKKNIQVSAVISRAKTLKSFLEKLERKHYPHPFRQVTDLAGARVVCLYPSDIPTIVEIIQTEFEILEDTNKVDELGVD